MASTSDRRQTDPDAEALEAVREAIPDPDEEGLVEHRPEDDPPEDVPRPLHNPLWGDAGDAP